MKMKIKSSAPRKLYNKAWVLFGMTEQPQGDVLTNSVLTITYSIGDNPNENADGIIMASSYYNENSLLEKARELSPRGKVEFL